MQLLRSVGNDGTVTGLELADLRYIVSSNSTYQMPGYVRELAKDVVNNNPANARFKGQNAGNLTAGSSSTLLNNLVDKWFLGADVPAITGSGISYQVSNGNLFNGDPSRANARQEHLGIVTLLPRLPRLQIRRQMPFATCLSTMAMAPTRCASSPVL